MFEPVDEILVLTTCHTSTYLYTATLCLLEAKALMRQACWSLHCLPVQKVIKSSDLALFHLDFIFFIYFNILELIDFLPFCMTSVGNKTKF